MSSYFKLQNGTNEYTIKSVSLDTTFGCAVYEMCTVTIKSILLFEKETAETGLLCHFKTSCSSSLH
jgi:hypothetical protein